MDYQKILKQADKYLSQPFSQGKSRSAGRFNRAKKFVEARYELSRRTKKVSNAHDNIE